ncbi:MAG: resolvase [Ruminococcus sp.]|nr:resolvase [Ruminococcus sp.]
MNRKRIYAQKQGVLNANDREALALLLVKAGYAVRIGKERPAGKTNGAYIYFVEYWEE